MTSTMSRLKIQRSEAEWRRQFTAEQFYHPAFTGPYWNEKRTGTYACVCCRMPLFSSQTKLESGTGWPSFWRSIVAEAADEHEDRSLFMRCTEVRRATCDAKLGHIFSDGPRPTGRRYCVNGTALTFTPKSDT